MMHADAWADWIEIVRQHPEGALLVIVILIVMWLVK